MRDGLAIFDADRHVIEPIELWRERLDPALRHRAPTLEAVAPREHLAERLVRLGPGGLSPVSTPMLEGRPLWNEIAPRAQIELQAAAAARGGLVRAGGEPASHVADMDRSGIDVAVLLPTFLSFMLGTDGLDPVLASGLARAYNAWLHDFCAFAPLRLRGAGAIAVHDPGGMVAELERVAELGFRAVVLRPNPTGGRALGDAAYAPFWAACERLSVAAVVHEGTHARVPSAGADRFASRFALHACSHPMELMMAFLSLLEGGVLERHPALRVAFLEAGAGWVPYWLFRLDEEYAQLRGEVAENVRMKPSAYFRRQCFVTIEPGEPYLAALLSHLGEDNLLFGTDFPHPDHQGDITEEALALASSLPAAAARKMLWDNAARLYGL